MTIARHYTMIAAPGKGEQLLGALQDLQRALVGINGFEGAELMRDTEDENRFVFIEKWTSVEAHKQGGEQLPKDAFAPVMGALGAKPEGAYLACIVSE